MSKQKNTFGIILVIVGCFLVLRELAPNIFSFGNIAHYLIPLGLIFLGGWLIVRKRRQEEHYSTFRESTGTTATESHHDSTHSSTEGNQSSSHFNDSSTGAGVKSEDKAKSSYGSVKSTRFSKLLGDTYIDCKDMSLQSIEVSSGIGDVEIKVHGGILADGLNRIIISGFIGDCRILVPPDMKIFAHCSNFIGDIEALNKRVSSLGNNLDVQSPDYTTAEKRLYIAANNFIGDIKIIEI
ncbi:MAG: cell wall-active antibiotics response protein LiaF [candidate division Zixibacteria bacterium]|nr:cell wall-active antibiotics response protein LiaF [candidate division Zixibacteria bacterium]